MSIILDPILYETVKKEADIIYKKNSAYKSGWIVKTYKDRGGLYYGEKPVNKGLDRWYKEKWYNIANADYPVYRPSVRINKETPLLPNEINKKNLYDQIALKQFYRGILNLPPFQKK
jgi:hypothetical protein